MAWHAPLYMGFPREESWSGLLAPSPGDLPHPEIESESPSLLHWHTDSLPLSHHGNQTSKSLWQKLCAWLNECPLHQNHIYRSLPCFFGAVSLRYLKYRSQATVLILLQIKLSLELSCCAFFLSQHSGAFLYTKSLWWSSTPYPKFAKFAPHWLFKLCFPPKFRDSGPRVGRISKVTRILGKKDHICFHSHLNGI